MNIFLGNPPENIKQWIINDYNRKQEEKRKIPLCFEAVDAGATVKLYYYGDNLKSATFQTSTDGQNWSDYTYEGPTIVLTNAGDKVYFRAKEDNTAIGRDEYNYLQFLPMRVENKLNISGNIMSLLSPEFKDLVDLSTIPGTHQFYSIFAECESIIDCRDLILPATTLANNCYNSMFYNCRSLTQAPALPATTLANNCYNSMFRGCKSLTQAPTIKTYTPNITAYYWMLNMYDQNTDSWLGKLTACTWNDLTISEAESMVLREDMFSGYYNPGDNVRISITCKDGSGIAYFDSEKWSWVFEY